MGNRSNAQLLSLIGHSFYFTDLDPLTPLHRDIGVKRVSFVCIGEKGDPEIGLVDLVDEDSVEFYYLDQLVMSPVIADQRTQTSAEARSARTVRRSRLPDCS